MEKSYGYFIITWLTNIVKLYISHYLSIKNNYKISIYIDIIALYIQSIIIFGLMDYEYLHHNLTTC
jgi:hypothetical protein